MTTMRVRVQHAGEGHAIDATTETGLKMAFDGDGGPHGPTPMQHVLAAAGACALMDVAHILRKKRLAFRDLRVECAGERPSEGYPKPFESIHLEFSVAGDVPTKVFDDAVRLALDKYCNVNATLRRATPIAFATRVEPGAAPAS